MSKILIVDDEAVNRLLLVSILQSAGHETLEAADGNDALRLAKDARPDLVIVDLYMPGMDGAELVKALRADGGVSGTNIALYTSTRTDMLLGDFMEMYGIKAIIPKPGEPPDVLRSVQDALAS